MTWNGKKNIAVAVPRLVGAARSNTYDVGQCASEVVSRHICLEVFDGSGSERSSLYANPCIHRAVPAFDVETAVQYSADQLAKVA